MLCPLCHTQNRDNAKFCKGCGRILNAEAGASVQPVSSPQSADAGQVQAFQGAPGPRLTQAQAESSSEAPSPFVRSDESARNGQASTSSPQTEAAGSTTAGGAGDSAPPPQVGPEDISAAPTQILTHDEMLALHRQHWQKEQDRARPQAGSADVADMPTIIQPAPSTTASEPDQARDIADYPTIVTPPLSDPAHQSPEPGATSTNSAGQVAQTSQEGGNAAQTESATNQGASVSTEGLTDKDKQETTQKQTEEAAQPVLAQSAAATAMASPNHEEDNVEQQGGQQTAAEQTTTAETGNMPQGGNGTHGTQAANGNAAQEQAAAGFPLLAVGTLVGTRYEVTQVINDSPEEHIYAVTDHQGYQRCWNCGSEGNTEGDEFCNDCGAELLNAPYVMHEYPINANQGDDRVLQGSIVNTIVDRGQTYVIEQPQVSQIIFPNGVHLLASSDSDAGTVRRSEVNEDSTLALLFERVHESVSMPTGLFIVADGMGGHANGQGASRATIGLISERIVRELIMPPLSAEKAGDSSNATPSIDEDSLLSLLHGSIEDANTTLVQSNQREKSDMGSTLTGFLVVGDHAYIFNVGDSRTYMLRDEKLYQLTNDHSLVGQLVAGGLIEPEDVYTHPQRNQIFRSIGDKPNVQIDLFKQQVHPGDILLSCSDGLWEMVRDPQIADILNHAGDPQTACTQLIEAANANGGEDNVSAVVVFVR